MEIFMAQLFLGSGGFFGGGFLLADGRHGGFPALRTFLGFADDDIIVVGTGNRSLDQQNILSLAPMKRKGAAEKKPAAAPAAEAKK